MAGFRTHFCGAGVSSPRLIRTPRQLITKSSTVLRRRAGNSAVAAAQPSLEQAQPGNGFPPGSQAARAAEQHQDSNSAGLREEVAELRALVAAQQETIQKLEGLVLGQAALAGQELLRQGSTPLQIGDRRKLGSYDARFHSTSASATPTDLRLLPRRIVLIRHAQSKGNVDAFQYTYVPDPSVPLTARGWEQALEAGEGLRKILESDGAKPKLYFYHSPYTRTKQTLEGIMQAFTPDEVLGVQEEVQLREQDFGNFQDAEGKKREKAERLRYGRFFYRFPHGESGADVYDRMTIFEDHLIRDINAGKFGHDSTVVLVTHGLAARVFLMKWYHWSVEQFLNVWNMPNASLIVLERITSETESRPGGPTSWIHTKGLYRLSDASMENLVGCTEDMCSMAWLPRGYGAPPSD